MGFLIFLFRRNARRNNKCEPQQCVVEEDISRDQVTAWEMTRDTPKSYTIISIHARQLLVKRRLDCLSNIGMRKEAIFGAVITTFLFSYEQSKATYHSLQERGR